MELTTLVNAYVNEYGIPLIKIFRFHPSAARAPVATREGLFQVTTIRAQLERLLAGEAALASTDAASAKHRSTQAVEIGIAALSGAAYLLILFGVFVVRGIAAPVDRWRPARATSPRATSRPGCRNAAPPRSSR